MLKLTRHAALGIILFGVLFGCSNIQSPTPGTSISSTRPETHSGDYLDVLEAVFRYQFDHNASAYQHNVDFFFISVDNVDPPPELIKRFANYEPRVLEGSEIAMSTASEAKQLQYGGRRLVLRVEDLKWIDSNTVELEGGYSEGGLSSSGSNYHLERRAGKWLVTNETMNWIS